VVAKTYILSMVDDQESESKRLDITEEGMEWIFNSLRFMQEKMQELATTERGKKLGRDDVLRAMGGPGPDKEYVLGDDAPKQEIDLGEDLFLPQYHDITELRESLVTFVGRDLTDG
jgi:hypothetical protein